MLNQIQGLHHVTSMAASAGANNAFFTDTLGLRRVKKTVNFDAPEVYHLYYGDEHGTPGSVMTYFPFPDMARRGKGAGEVGADGLRGAEGVARLLARAAGGAGCRGTRRGLALRRDAAELHRAGRRRAGAGRGRRSARALDRGRGAGGGGDPRLQRRVAPAARRRRDGRAAALHGLRGGGDGRRGDALPARGRQRRRRCRHRDAARGAARRARRRARCTTSPSRCPTGRRSSKCAKRWPTPATR